MIGFQCVWTQVVTATVEILLASVPFEEQPKAYPSHHTNTNNETRLANGTPPRHLICMSANRMVSAHPETCSFFRMAVNASETHPTAILVPERL